MRVLLFSCLAFLLLLPTPEASADGFADTRKAFESAMEGDWSAREQAFLPLIDYDGPEVVALIVAHLGKETNGVVLNTAIKTLAGLESEGAKTALVEAARKAKPPMRDYVMMALGQMKGDTGADLLLEVLQGAKEPQQRAMAALAIGDKGLEATVPALVAALDDKDWHVVSAAARALGQLAWSGWTEPKNPKEGKKPAKPAWWKDDLAVAPLANRLAKADGAERGDLIAALERISGQELGWNVDAWRKVAAGEKPDAATLRKQKHPPYMFGIPLYGKRIVIVVDASVLNDNAVPFEGRDRLKEVCKVPGARPLLWSKIKTVGDFSAAHVSRGIQDLPSKKQKFEVIFSAIKPRALFGKLDAANAGKKKAAIEAIGKLRRSNENDILATMNAALDAGGEKESKAWKKGPDEILCVYTSVPWLAPETDAAVIGNTIGLKARRRMVRIHAVGVREYAYEMMRLFAHLSGGRYEALTK